MLNKLLKRLLQRRKPEPLIDASCLGLKVTWGNGDRAALAHFLKSPAGQSLQVTLRQLTFFSQRAAIHSKDNLAYQCGIAAGVEHVVGLIDQMAVPQEEVERKADNRPDDSLNWMHNDEHDDEQH